MVAWGPTAEGIALSTNITKKSCSGSHPLQVNTLGTVKLDSRIVSEYKFFYMAFDVSLFERGRKRERAKERAQERKLASEQFHLELV